MATEETTPPEPESEGLDLLLAYVSARRQVYSAVRDLLAEQGARDAERRAQAAADYAIARASLGDQASAARAAGMAPRTATRVEALVQEAGARRGLVV